jgi:hypothetical protein
MEIQSKREDDNFPISTKDTILLILFGSGALLCFSLSFTLLQDNGRPFLFGGSLVLCLLCILLAQKRKEMLLGTVGFIAIRVLWGIVVTGLHIFQLGLRHH